MVMPSWQKPEAGKATIEITKAQTSDPELTPVIWKQLVRDLIPVRDTLGELAMYDLVNKKYHKCAGTGKFV